MKDLNNPEMDGTNIIDHMYGKKNDEFEIKGKWWIQENSKEKLFGVLKYSKGAGLLELEGVFRDNNMMREPSHTGLTILGDVIGMKGVLLANCFLISTTKRTEYISHMIFTNCDFEKLDDVSFKEYCIRFEYLEEWVKWENKSLEDLGENLGFNSNMSISFLNNNPDIDIHLRHQKPVEVATVEGYDIRINPIYGIEDQTDNSDFSIKQKTFFLVKSKKPRNFVETEKFVRTLQNFYSFAIDSPAHHLQIIAYPDEDDMEVNNDRNAVGVFYSSSTSRLASIHGRFLDVGILFDFDDTRDFQKIVEKWFELTENYEPMITAISAVKNSLGMHVDAVYLFYSLALESYHTMRTERRKIESRNDDCQKKIKTLCDRLIDLIKEHPVLIDKSIGEKPESHAKMIADIRNDIIHGNKERRIDKTDMSILTNRVKMLILAVILKELDFSNEEIEHIIEDKKFWLGTDRY